MTTMSEEISSGSRQRREKRVSWVDWLSTRIYLLHERMDRCPTGSIEPWEPLSADEPDERVDEIRPPPSAGRFLPEFSAGLLRGRRGFVGTCRRRRVEHVDDAHDLRQKRNIVATQTVGIASAVAQLVVMPYDRPHASLAIPTVCV